MSISEVVDALDLPSETLVGKRIPKRVLSSHAASTAADRRRIDSDIAEVHWVASLKPTTFAVPSFTDDERQYLEIALIGVELRGTPARLRLIEIIHRSVPHPVMLIDELDGTTSISAAAKRWSRAASREVVVAPPLYSAQVAMLRANASESDGLRKFLSLAVRQFHDMAALYDQWIDLICMVNAAERTGRIVPLTDPGDRLSRRAGLADAQRLEAAIAGLRSEARRAMRMADRVEINLRLQGLRAELDTATAAL